MVSFIFEIVDLCGAIVKVSQEGNIRNISRLWCNSLSNVTGEGLRKILAPPLMALNLCNTGSEKL